MVAGSEVVVEPVGHSVVGAAIVLTDVSGENVSSKRNRRLWLNGSGDDDGDLHLLNSDDRLLLLHHAGVGVEVLLLSRDSSFEEAVVSELQQFHRERRAIVDFILRHLLELVSLANLVEQVTTSGRDDWHSSFFEGVSLLVGSLLLLGVLVVILLRQNILLLLLNDGDVDGGSGSGRIVSRHVELI